MTKQRRGRDGRWTESITVGNEVFVRETKEKLRIRAMGREVIGENRSYELPEQEVSYNGHFDPENADLRQENTFLWDISD